MYIKTFSSSLICIDHLNIRSTLNTLLELGLTDLHIDIMDGHAVPRFGVYPELIQQINNSFPMIGLDLHFMVSDVEFSINQFKNVKFVRNVTFHIDGNEGKAVYLIDQIRSLFPWANVGVAVNLGSSMDSTIELIRLNQLDRIMFMLIHPGVLKQTARGPDALLHKISRVLELNSGISLEVDGGVTFETIPHLFEMGIDTIVGGSGTIFKGIDLLRDSSEIQRSKIIDNWRKIEVFSDYWG